VIERLRHPGIQLLFEIRLRVTKARQQAVILLARIR
jgi:hypothetical protein